MKHVLILDPDVEKVESLCCSAVKAKAACGNLTVTMVVIASSVFQNRKQRETSNWGKETLLSTIDHYYGNLKLNP